MENFFCLATISDINRIEWNRQPVLTTSQLAAALLTLDKIVSAANLSANFKNNESRFIEGKHFFKLEGEALRSFKDEFRAALLIRALQAYLVDNELIEQQEELTGKQLEKRTKNNEKIIDTLESLL